MRKLLRLLPLLLCAFPVQAQQYLRTEVLVIGGTTGGTAAGIQCARNGVSTLIVEQTPWLGGMLTAAGVSCTDGNDELKSGIWQEFREALYRHYGKRNLFTGWVSETCFEPAVGDSIFKAMAGNEKKLAVKYNWYFDRVLKQGNRVTGAVFVNKKKQTLRVTAALVIDATDLGDAYASAGAGFDIGMEDPLYSGEKMAPGTFNVIQDLTWAATLMDYGAGADKTIARPPGYDSTLYFCSSTDAPCTGKPWNGTSRKMLDYGKLPLSPGKQLTKYMLNWPPHGNDYYINVIDLKPLAREAALLPARNKTLGFIYFIQTKLGYRQIGLAPEFPSADGLALVPYHREGRRLKGVVRLNVNHLTAPFDQPDALYRTGIAVGDYPVDHHHAPEKKAPGIDFPAVPSFNVPLGALIPERVEGLIVCEKGISVSNIVNGSTRLQPCVLLTGQAAGQLAATAFLQKRAPHNVDLRVIQQHLLEARAFLMPYLDVQPEDPDWPAVQRIGATGILRGTGKPEGWANKTFFYPDSTVLLSMLEKHLSDFYGPFATDLSMKNRPVTLNDIAVLIKLLGGKPVPEPDPALMAPTRPLNRKQVAVLLDRYLDPFRIPIDWKGRPVK